MKTIHATNRSEAFTLLELLLVILVLVILAAVFLPDSRSHSYAKAKRINCVNNLKEIGLAFKVWEGDNTNRYPMEVSAINGGAMESAEKGIAYPAFQVMSNELSTPKLLICPEDIKRIVATNFSIGFDNSHLSYFVGLVTNDANPQMILSGDDNLAVNGMPVQPGILTLWTNSPVAWTKERHHNVGNIGLADGSVQQVTTSRLISAISNAASPSRLVIP